MSPLLNVGEEGESNVSLVAFSASTDNAYLGSPGLKEHNYMGLSDCSSAESHVTSNFPDEKGSNLNLKATELTLGLPGSQSPVRVPEISLSGSKLDEKPLFPLLPVKDAVTSALAKTIVSGNKRGFSDAMDGFPELKSSSYRDGNWIFSTTRSQQDTPPSMVQAKYPGNAGAKVIPNSMGKPVTVIEQSGSSTLLKEIMPSNTTPDGPRNSINSNGTAPDPKAQVVGWPPIRSFRKNTLATSSKNNEEVDGKPGSSVLFIKVSMDGAPYLRKVDLKTYSSYLELSSALEKMFSCFTIGRYGSHEVPGREKLSESRLQDLLHSSEFVVTYEDKDGDWMLVGDVPWDMFIDSCKRLRIMKSSDAIGLAPRAMEKSRKQN